MKLLSRLRINRAMLPLLHILSLHLQRKFCLSCLFLRGHFFNRQSASFGSEFTELMSNILFIVECGCWLKLILVPMSPVTTTLREDSNTVFETILFSRTVHRTKTGT